MSLENASIEKVQKEVESIVISLETENAKILIQCDVLPELMPIPEELYYVFSEEEVRISRDGKRYILDSDWRWCCLVLHLDVEVGGSKLYGRDYLRCASYANSDEFLSSHDIVSMVESAIFDTFDDREDPGKYLELLQKAIPSFV